MRRSSYTDDGLLKVPPHIQALNPRLVEALDEADEDEVWMERGRLRVNLYNPANELTPGVICAEAISHYSHGNCALLALCLLDARPDFIPVNVRRQGNRNVHALVKTPAGLYLDIKGLHSADEICRAWQHHSGVPGTLRETTRPHFEQLWGTADDTYPLAVEVARTFAAQLLRDHAQHLDA